VSANVTVKDGTGTNTEVKVRESGPQDENSMWVHLSGLTPEVTVPTFGGPIANGELFSDTLKNAGSDDLTVDGSATPVNFRIESDPDFDIIINQIVLAGSDGSIKLTNFFGLNSPLTNGIVISFQSDDTDGLFRTIRSTTDYLSFSSGDNNVYSEQGSAAAFSFRTLNPPLIIRKTGTHGGDAADDDYIQITIQDNLVGLDSLTCNVRGVKVPAGIF
jgi:hypothetical protein